MTPGDVPAVLAVQEPGAVRALSTIFPQDEYPFPREDIGRTWLQEIADPGIECAVAVRGEAVIGFAAVRGAELLHLGTAVERWGTGDAERMHDAILEGMREGGVGRAFLKVFEGNARARRFYERLGWRRTGERRVSAFPPHPELLVYERDPAGFSQTSR
ncbi:Acetyltransferase (GNAT) family protein [Blastococcus aggregatus]|uniref:Acetyltransferase (GNAT) family protein n=2 Tax=Blastococcus aggregatus TaxID=38502 RepID=A0A285VHY2_9ACTN|nr:Acetyltransferase (GNAT) family protein [Blastococcus aggregatus]